MTLVILAVLTGSSVSVLTAYLAIRRVIQSRWLLPAGRVSTSFAHGIAWGLAIVAFPFAWFLGFVAGSNFGGAIFSVISESTGVPEKLLIPFGIAIGIFLCTTLLSIGASIVGFIVARLIERIWNHPPAIGG